ncbi:MAG: ShlB/FhaC/HecB family hemolysin secretion/activation protein [Nevskia sp.]|nr:ShlB/FhaC/HecB family hemolysin secretion/activation protein [Nevskia sp.]
MSVNWRGNSSSLVFALGCLALSAKAADPALPTPGSINDSLKPATPLHSPQPAVLPDAPPNPSAVAPTTGPTVTVASFQLSGNTLFSERRLQSLLTSYLNRPVTIGELYQAADKITAFYQQAGYTLTSVTLPAQSVEAGVVQLQIVEGRVERIEFDSKGYSPQVLNGYLSQTRPGEIYRAEHLESDLETLNALPGLSARAVLQPGTQFGTSDIVIKAHNDPIDLVGMVDNYGRKDVGEYRYSAGITLNNPLGLADRLQLFGVHSNTGRLNYGYVDYNLALNRRGLRFNADYGYAKFDVAPPFPVSGKNVTLDANFEQLLIRSSKDLLLGTIGFTHTNANADLSGLPISDTNLNLMTLGGTYSHSAADGAVTQFVVGLHSNFHSATTTERNRERLRMEIDGQHLQPLFAHLELLLHVDAVYSRDALPDTDQLSIGGPTSIRGFAPSEARGDRGYYAQGTLRRAFAIGPVIVVPRIFADTGVITRIDVTPGTDTHDSLSSAGIGVDLAYKKFSAKIDWSHPLDSTPTSDGRDDGRVYAAITAGF